VLGVASAAVGYARGWTGLPWLVAVPADLMAVLLVATAVFADRERLAGLLRPESLIVMLVALVIVQVGVVVARRITTGRQLAPVEIGQGLAATLVGLGGAVAVSKVHDTAWIGVAALAYVASFTTIDRAASRTNFIFTSSLALIFVLVAGLELFSPSVLAVTLAAGAVVMAWAGAWTQRATLSLHGAVYAVGAAIASGMLHQAARALTAPQLDRSGWGARASLAALAGAVVYGAFPVATHGRTWGRLSTLPKLVVLIVAAVGVAGVVTAVVAVRLPGPDAGPTPESVAVLRTAVLAAAAVALAGVGARFGRRHAVWLGYAALVIGGIKLIVEDFRVGRPATLVLSLALYGGALILTPWLSKESEGR
jgi:hypothetical protein